MKRETICPHCGRKDVEYRHHMNKGLLSALRRLYEVAGARPEVLIHLADIGLTHNQHANFQKLQYFGLVRNDGKRSGNWSVTAAGHSFLRLWSAIPAHVWTYRGVKAKYDPDEEVPSVYATEVDETYKLPDEWRAEERPVNLDAVQLQLPVAA